MDIQSENKKISHPEKNISPVCSILSALAAVLSFLSNREIETQIFFILFSFILIFKYFSLKNGYAKNKLHLFWKISGVTIVVLFICNSEKTASEDENISNVTSSDRSEFKSSYDNHYIPQQKHLNPTHLHNSLLDNKVFDSSTPSEKKASYDIRPVYIEEYPETPIMKTPKDAGDKKIITPVLHFST